jgi:Rad3-related DNA helicase
MWGRRAGRDGSSSTGIQGLRRLAAALSVLLLAAAPARAYLVEVTTSVSVADSEDQDAVRTALLNAVDDVLTKAIAFPPALVVLTSATLVNARLYIRLLVADEDGAKTFDELEGGGPEEQPAELRI